MWQHSLPPIESCDALIQSMSTKTISKLDLNLWRIICTIRVGMILKINAKPHGIREILKLRQAFVQIHSMLQLRFSLI